ncbi:MAG: biotin-independent malonate decarboxylase subunit beta [Desulfuromonadaceae bacterium]|nr:biotin-independent malonate decarboxylase subunit beta [Desulfuromonadaceae bacterium]
MKNVKPASFFESSARVRVAKLVDAGSFKEFCPPQLRRTSPHLARLNAPVAFDDGVAVGSATLAGHKILIAAQEGKFNGGAVGEVHGAKLAGLLDRGVRELPRAVLLLIDSGGVRLHEANAGLIAISEVMRAVLRCQEAGVPVLALVGGACGAFGGMGIVTRLCNEIIMSEEGRLGLSGPEVIETVQGVEEFDSRDRPLVWRVTGGKVRRALGEATYLVDDDICSFRSVTAELLCRYQTKPLAPVDIDEISAEHARLTERTKRFATARDGREIFQASGFVDLDEVSLLPVAKFNQQLLESL